MCKCYAHLTCLNVLLKTLLERLPPKEHHINTIIHRFPLGVNGMKIFFMISEDTIRKEKRIKERETDDNTTEQGEI